MKILILVVCLFTVFSLNAEVKNSAFDEFTKNMSIYNPTIQISVRNKNDKDFLQKSTVSLADFSKNLEATPFVILKHPVYADKPVKYDGFYFNDVVKLINKKLKIKNPKNYIYSIWASDNFSAFVTNEDLTSGKAFLAWHEMEFADPKNKTEDLLWTKIDKHGSPGPFYLVWNNPEKTYWQKWPFKIAEITLISKDVANKFTKLKPKDDFVLNKGYNLVLKNCTSCHQVAKTGFANMGPDLKDLAKLRDEKDFLKQIRQPSGKMLPFTPDILSNDDVSPIYIYLKQLQ